MSYQPLTVGDALTRGWNAFMSRIKDFLIVGIVVGLIFGVLTAVVVLFWVGTASSTDIVIDSRTGAVTTVGGGWLAGFFGSFIVLGIILGIGSILAALYNTRIALAAVDGESYELGSLIRQANKYFAPFLGWMILSGILTALGLIALCIGALVVAFFLIFVPFVVLERDRHPGVNPLSGSFNAVKDQAGNLILIFLVFLAIGIGVGLVGQVLQIIPFVGQVVSAILQILFGAFGLCVFAVVYRASPIGSAVGGTGVTGTAVPPYGPGYPQQGYPPAPPAPPQAPQQGYPPAPPAPPQAPPQGYPPAPPYPPQGPPQAPPPPQYPPQGPPQAPPPPQYPPQQ